MKLYKNPDLFHLSKGKGLNSVFSLYIHRKAWYNVQRDLCSGQEYFMIFRPVLRFAGGRGLVGAAEVRRVPQLAGAFKTAI